MAVNWNHLLMSTWDAGSKRRNNVRAGFNCLYQTLLMIINCEIAAHMMLFISTELYLQCVLKWGLVGQSKCAKEGH